MSDKQLPAIGGKSFEDLKKTNQHGAEYWSARDLQPLLGYSQWRRFEQAIKRALTSCRQSGNNPSHHFADAGKMVGLGSGSVREVADYHLSRFACYLIAQNSDPRKPEIAQAQKYFAVQTRRQELSSWPPIWSGWSCANTPARSSKRCPALPSRRVFRVRCSEAAPRSSSTENIGPWRAHSNASTVPAAPGRLW